MIGNWVRATGLGWMLGLLFITAAALVAEALGVGGTQSPVGIGMGLGVSLLQARALREILPDGRAWVLHSTAALAAPFLIGDLARAAGFDLPYSLYVSVAVGGAATGFAQATLLARRLENTWLWILASLAGWGLAAAVASTAGLLPPLLSVRGPKGALIYLGATLAGGWVLAWITGLALTRLLVPPAGAPKRRPPPPRSPNSH